MGNIFKQVKNLLTPIEIAKRYLGQPNKVMRNTYLYYSPFRKEKTPSFIVSNEKGFHDFGDSWHGDIVSFVGRLYNLTPIQSTNMIIADFSLAVNTNNGNINKKEIRKLEKKRNKEKQIESGLDKWFRSFYR